MRNITRQEHTDVSKNLLLPKQLKHDKGTGLFETNISVRLPQWVQNNKKRLTKRDRANGKHFIFQFSLFCFVFSFSKSSFILF
jgi:hypothetical protein